MAFSYDTGASPSRRSRQAWPALFVATSTSLQSCGRCFERPVHEWMNGRFDAYQHQAPSRQETNGWRSDRLAVLGWCWSVDAAMEEKVTVLRTKPF